MLDTHSVLLEVANQLMELDKERQRRGESIDFSSTQDGMLYLHRAWQSMMTAVRKTDSKNKSAVAAIYLAATAVKFAADLGTCQGPVSVEDDDDTEDDAY